MSRLAGADNDFRPFSETRRDASHVCRPYGDAAGRRPQVFMGEMEKNRAPAPNRSRPDIEVENAHDIIKVVFAPQRFRAGAGRQPDGAVVVSGGGVVAPAVAPAYGARRVHNSAPAVRSPQPAQNRKTSHGRDAVAFPAFEADAAFSERAVHRGRADPHHAPPELP